MIVGNDISVFQGDINYDTLKSNANFVISKASEGTGFTDPKFGRNQSEARRVSLPLGYYHFARPDLGNDAAHEADWFLKVIGEIREGEVLCLDFEVTYTDCVNWCKNWLDRVKFMTNGCKPLIYLNQSQLHEFNWQPIVDAGYALWIAAYVDDTNFFTGNWPSAALQQWTSGQQVPGISGNCDGDRFFGDLNAFKAYGFHKPVPVPPTPPPVPPIPPPDNPPPPVIIPPPVVTPEPPIDPEKHNCTYFGFGVYICTLKKP
jgi:lysozyme